MENLRVFKFERALKVAFSFSSTRYLDKYYNKRTSSSIKRMEGDGFENDETNGRGNRRAGKEGSIVGWKVSLRGDGCTGVTAPRGKAGGPDVGSRRVAPVVAAEW